jgi:hypothetical protein
MHGLTVALALVCLGCGALAWRHARLKNGDDSGSTKANLRFLGQLGVAIAAVNLLLIVVEGIYVPFLDSCPRH